MENNISPTGIQPITPASSTNQNIVKLIRFLVIFAVISPVVYSNYLLRTKLEKYTSNQPGPQPTPTVTITSSPTPTSVPFTPTVSLTEPKLDQWQTAKHGGVFSYSYPSGWHVAELWPQMTGGPIRLAMDPNPITTAPMGGPSSTFNINFYNGLPKPDAKLADLKAELKPEYFSEIKTETIDSVNGPVFYHSGKMSGEYMNGTKVETYLFTVKRSASDPQNVQVMQGTLYGGDQKQSEMLRYIVLSFKSL